MKLNNKGYMLVEIILASVLAMVVVYFITNLTIKLKNKNDDLLVKTLISTDQAIIYNAIMKDLYENPDTFSCSNINIVENDNVFKYKEFTNIVNKYTNIEYDSTSGCYNGSDEIRVNIGLGVKQLPDENYDVVIRHKK